MLQVSCDICRLEMKGFAPEIYCFYPQAVNCFFSYRRNGRMGNVTVLECSSSHVLRCGGNFQFSFIFTVLIFCMCDSVLSDAEGLMCHADL